MKQILTCLLLLLTAWNATAQTEQLDSIYNAAEKAASRQRWPEAFALARRYTTTCGAQKTTVSYSKMLS